MAVRSRSKQVPKGLGPTVRRPDLSTPMARAFLDFYAFKRQKARRTGDGPGSDTLAYYVSPTGDDGNDGTSASTAWATLAKAQSELADDVTLRLERGGAWEESLDITHDNVTLTAYGSGDAPIVDASSPVPTGSWVKEAGYTNIYKYTVAYTAVDTDHWINVWEDDDWMVKQAGIAAVDTAPGGYTFVITTGVGFTIYVHATGSGNPASNGKAYRVTRRMTAVTSGGTGFVMDGIETRRQINNNGSFIGGGILRNCRFIDGHKHNAIVNAGTLLENCHFEGSYYGGQNASYVVTFAVNAEGLPLTTYRDCVFVGRGDTQIANPTLAHAVAGLFDGFLMEDCTFENFSNGAGFSDAKSVTFRGCRFLNVGIPISGGDLNVSADAETIADIALVVEDCHAIGGFLRAINITTAMGSLTVTGCKFYGSANVDGFIYSLNTATAITVENSVFRHRNTGPLIVARHTLAATGNSYDTPGYVYSVAELADLTSNTNKFLSGAARVLTVSPSTDNQIAAYLSASSQDAASTWNANGRPATAFSYTEPARYSLPSGSISFDPSYSQPNLPLLNQTVTSIPCRVGGVTALAEAGTPLPILDPGERMLLSVNTGGDNTARLDASGDTADNLFSAGGMLAVVLSQPFTSGIVAAKWATTGWILYGTDANTLTLEAYATDGSSVAHQFPVPFINQRYLLEVEWNSDDPNTAPVVRANGTSRTVTTSGTANGPVDDTPGTLCIGNRNWGGLNTPWVGLIGEIVLLPAVPTSQQKTDLRADLTAHWQIT